MKYYHFMVEDDQKCYATEVVLLRMLKEADYQTWARLENSLFEAFQGLSGESLEAYFKESDAFFASVEAAQEPRPTEEVFEGSRFPVKSRKSAIFSMAHSLTKAILSEGDNYTVTFGQCLKLIYQYI